MLHPNENATGAAPQATRATSSRPARRSRKPSAARAESVVLGIARSLSIDAACHPASRDRHLAYIDGATALAAALGFISDERVSEMRCACRVMFDAAARSMAIGLARDTRLRAGEDMEE